MGFSNEELKWIKKMILSRAPNKDTLDKLISLASSKNINSLSLQDISSLKQFLDLLEKDILKQLYTNISPTRKLINIGWELKGQPPLKIVPNSLVLQTIKKDNLTIKEALIKLDQENVSQALIDLNQGALEKSALDGSREAFIYLASTSTSFDNNNPINTLNSELLAMYNVKEIQEKLNILKNFTDISNNSELKKLHTDALKLTKNSRKKLQERMK